MKFSELYVVLGLRDERFRKGMKGAQKQVGVFGKSMKSLGMIFAGTFAVQTIFNFARALFRMNVKFERTMSGVRAITNATNKEFKELTNSARQLGRVTTKTASEVASLQKEFALIGFSTKEIMNATAATIQLAEGTGEDLADSARIAGATLRGFGIDASETQRIVDLMATSFTSSALNLERWGESMKYIAPIAKKAGITVEETAAMLSVLADAGIHGSMAGTGMRKIISELDDAGKPLIERLKELAAKGITLAEANDEVGQRAKTALLVLMEMTDEIENQTAAMDDNTGAAKRMSDVATNNLQGALARLGSEFQQQGLGAQAWGGVLKWIIDVTTSAVRVTGELGEELKKILTIKESFVSKAIFGDRWSGKKSKYNLDITPEQAMDDASFSWFKFGGTVDGVTSRVDDAYKATQKYYDILINGDGITEDVYNSYMKLIDELEAYIDKETKVIPIVETKLSLIQQYKEKIENLKKALKEAQTIEDIERIKALLGVEKDRLSYLESYIDAKKEQIAVEKYFYNQQQKFIKDLKVGEGYSDEQKRWDQELYGGYEPPEVVDQEDAPFPYVDITTLEEQQEAFKKYGDTINAINESIAASAQLAASVLDEQSGSFVNFVAQVAIQVLRLIGIYQAEAAAAAMAGGAEAGMATGPASIWTTPAFMAAALASVLIIFASIPKFAGGGIIGGRSFSGDNMLIGANSGEMVLNGMQQRNLFKMLNLGGGGFPNEIMLKARGSDLIGVIYNENRHRN